MNAQHFFQLNAMSEVCFRSSKVLTLSLSPVQLLELGRLNESIDNSIVLPGTAVMSHWQLELRG